MPLHMPRALVALAVIAASPRQNVGAATVPQPTPGSAVENAPAPTHWESIAFDAARRRLVVFGGTRQVGNTWQDLNETREWDGTGWHSLPAPADGPGPRRAHALAYDPGARRIVLAGGVRTRPGSQTDDPYDDTWTFDGQRWQAGPAIPIMSGHSLVYSERDRAMLLLGYLGREQFQARRLVIWRRSADGWTFADSTGPRMEGTVRAAYDTRRSVLVVPVMHEASTRVWEWDGRRWQTFDIQGPAPRSSHTVAYDAGTGRVVLAAGRDRSRNTLGDVWEWDGRRWTAAGATITPDPRSGASLVADDASGRLLLYGGMVPGRGLVSELWTRAGSVWTRWEPAQSAPQTRTTPALSAARGAFIGVSVRDLDATVRWYTEMLGLTVVMRPPKIEKSAAVILEGGNLIVELMRHDDAVPLATAAPSITRNYLVTGIFKAGIIVEDFDKAIAELRTRGVPIAIGPFAATAEQRANAIIRDNEGNYIQLFGAR